MHQNGLPGTSEPAMLLNPYPGTLGIYMPPLAGGHTINREFMTNICIYTNKI